MAFAYLLTFEYTASKYVLAIFWSD